MDEIEVYPFLVLQGFCELFSLMLIIKQGAPNLSQYFGLQTIYGDKNKKRKKKNNKLFTEIRNLSSLLHE